MPYHHMKIMIQRHTHVTMIAEMLYDTFFCNQMKHLLYSERRIHYNFAPEFTNKANN